MSRALPARSARRSDCRDRVPGAGFRNTFSLPPRRATAEARKIDAFADQRANRLLLLVCIGRGVDHGEPELGGQCIVLLLDAALENSKALVDVTREIEVHSGLEPLELWPALEDAVERDLERKAEVQGEIRLAGKPVRVAQPGRVAPPYSIPGERRVNVAITEYDIPRSQHGQNLALVAVGEIGCMNEAERRRRQQLALLGLAGRALHQLTGIPFRE